MKAALFRSASSPDINACVSCPPAPGNAHAGRCCAHRDITLRSPHANVAKLARADDHASAQPLSSSSRTVRSHRVDLIKSMSPQVILTSTSRISIQRHSQRGRRGSLTRQRALAVSCSE